MFSMRNRPGFDSRRGALNVLSLVALSIALLLVRCAQENYELSSTRVGTSVNQIAYPEVTPSQHLTFMQIKDLSSRSVRGGQASARYGRPDRHLRCLPLERNRVAAARDAQSMPDVIEGIWHEGVYEIHIAPSNSNILYMQYLGIVYKSTDKGATWTKTEFAHVALESE